MKGLGVQESKKEVIKIFPLQKNLQKIYQMYPFFLKQPMVPKQILNADKFILQIETGHIHPINDCKFSK